MVVNPDLERCHTFINCQLEGPHNRKVQARLALTLSRETGTGGRLIARKLTEYLQPRGPDRECPWTVFDHNLVEKVIEHHHLPKELARYLPEDRVSLLDDIMEDLFGLHPPAWNMAQQFAQTILKLTELGNCIIVGRGSNIISRRLPHVFHVRLVGTLERRIERFCRTENLDPHAAREAILKSDHARERYVQQQFHKAVNDPHLYDLVLNTDSLEDDLAAEIIGGAALSFNKRTQPTVRG